ncbi:MAG: hypothetical protein AB1529_02405 [Candidatus Micrarchaeota archaeon]
MRKSLVRSDEEFGQGMRLLERDLGNVFRNAQNAPPEQRAWARDVLEEAARIARSGGDRRSLERMLRSPPSGVSAQLVSALATAANSALSLPDTQQQRAAVGSELENAASQLYSGHLPGQGPPAGMLEHYRRVMKSTPRKQ